MYDGYVVSVRPAIKPGVLSRLAESAWSVSAVPLVLVAIWFAVDRSGLVNSPLLVSPEKFLFALLHDPDGQELWAGLGFSLLRLTGGFAIGASLGIAVGFLIGMSRTADRTFGPSYNALRQVTLFAWIPLLTAWLGSGDLAKIVFISMSAFFPTVLNTQEGLQSISAQHLETARVLRLSRWRRITQVLLPGALPSIFTGLQTALIVSWLSTIGAEYAMGIGQGIGMFLAHGREMFRMDLVVIAVLALGVVGYLLNVGCRLLFGHLLRWQGKVR
jgi:sulfonate transport system permease protein